MSARTDRELLVELFAVLEDPARAAALAPHDAVLAVARRHRLTPLVSITCAETLPAELAQECRRDRVLTTARSLALATLAEECVAGLARAGVEAVLLKGLAYERLLYAQPGTRPSSDVDLLVRERDRRAAFAALDGLGFEPRAAAPGFDDADYHEVAWRRGALEIDLHMALAPYVRCAIDYDEVWREVRELPVGGARALALSPAHAAVFHALHMAIDHFDVPGLYLIDLIRLLPDASATRRAEETARAWRCHRPFASATRRAEETARAWRCHRPFATARALAAAFQPGWAESQPPASSQADAARAREVVARFGTVAPLPRIDQLRRKLTHFDAATDLVRYTLVQARRKLREPLQRRLLGRSARERIGLGDKPGRP